MPLYLTFDDGPDPSTTPRVLEALHENRARATFFVLGTKVRRHPELVPEILRAGHRVELHGDDHLDHLVASDAEIAVDTEWALESLADVGVSPQWWRLPWGRQGDVTAGLAREHGLRIAGWDADTHDWRGDRWRAQPDTVRRAVTHGGVVLMHDANGPGARRRGVINTVALIHELLARTEVNVPPLRFPDAGVPAADRIPAGAPSALESEPRGAAPPKA
jgi:peptidoglycan/xylan/chitin deacetylase (PgdA/CDA1 family)